ncbi:MAG TPA: EI24 domain-containing protein [Polyangiaceae bacterium]|nr:EI24 domain-containing protein [Polyangiaceae bacterium]
MSDPPRGRASSQRASGGEGPQAVVRSVGKPGFGSGLTAIGGAISYLAKRSELWPLAMVPTLIFVAIVLSGAVFGSIGAIPWLIHQLGLGDGTAWYSSVGRGAAGLLGFLLSGFISVALAFLLTPTLSAPALERLVAHQETALDAPPRAAQSWIRECWYGLQAQAFSTAVAIPSLVVLFALELMIPWGAPLFGAAQWLVLCLCLAWNLLDTPLTMRGVPAAVRIGVLMEHRAAVLGFGMGFALLFWVPCLTIVLLPIGAVAAARLTWQMAGGSEEGYARLKSGQHSRDPN